MEETITIFSTADRSVPGGIYRWGIEVIRTLQTIENPSLTAIMRGITQLGAEPFYIAALLFVFWCLDEKQGFRFALLIFLSGWLNGFCKLIFKQPRPFHLDPSLTVASGITEPLRGSYGFPSGHAQLSLVFWASLAGWAHRRVGKIAAYITAVFFVLAIAVTRLYLGVHFPTDILGGWFLGALVLALFFFFDAPIAALLRSGGLRPQLVSAALAGFLMNASGVEESVGGLFLGFCAGYALTRARVGFSARKAVRGKRPGGGIWCARYVIGITCLLALQFLLRVLLPGEDALFGGSALWGAASPWSRLGRFVRYGGLGFFASVGAPWLFIRLGLAGRDTPAGTDAGADAPAPAVTAPREVPTAPGEAAASTSETAGDGDGRHE
jgi:membrane-associated phospholipid phosphatase